MINNIIKSTKFIKQLQTFSNTIEKQYEISQYKFKYLLICMDIQFSILLQFIQGLFTQFLQFNISYKENTLTMILVEIPQITFSVIVLAQIQNVISLP
ncbi:hypothetical protein pb186bvf_001263 [Paramecium bursaria]